MGPRQSDAAVLPIIDSHIHLYAKTHLPSLNWATDLAEGFPLNRQNSIDEYKTASRAQKNLVGFVFLETDRKSGLESTEWQAPFDEVDFLIRIATGHPIKGEGHSPEDNKLVLGVVPWAPLPAGINLLKQYVETVESKFARAGIPGRLSGFRYLLQDKNPGVMLQPEFVDGLRYLGEKGLSFDLGVDSHRGGMHQLKESAELLQQLQDSDSQVRIILNHFCKPNMTLTVADARNGHPQFMEWKKHVEQMAKYPFAFMKLSGWTTEMPPQDEEMPLEIQELVDRTKPWADVVFDAFSPSRILFGSDWPVVNLGGIGLHKSWQYWHDLVEAILNSRNLNTESRGQIWSGTAVKAYNLEIESN